MPTKLWPPSVVRTIEVQGGSEHGAVPSSHQVRSLIAVNDVGSKPGGTGPEDGPRSEAAAGEVAVRVRVPEPCLARGVAGAEWPCRRVRAAAEPPRPPP